MKEIHREPIVVCGAAVKPFHPMPQQTEVHFNTEDARKFHLVHAGIHIVPCVLAAGPLEPARISSQRAELTAHTSSPLHIH